MTKSKSKTKVAARAAGRKISKGKSHARSALTSSKPAARRDTKHDRIIAMLRAPAGATIAAIMAMTEAGVRYRYYVSLPHLHGESKTASVGSVSRVPATDIENLIVKSLNEHLVAQKEKPAFNLTHVRDGKAALEQVARIDVHEDRLAIRLKSADDEETADAADGHLLSIPWQKPPSRKSRQILILDGIPKSEIRPTRIERRARLVSAIARSRRWLDEIVSGSRTDVQQI